MPTDRTPSAAQRRDDLRVIHDYLDWQYAINGAARTVEFHRQLVREDRPMPTLTEAREAIARLRAES